MQHVHAWRSTIFRPYHAFHEIYMGLQPLNHEWFLQACFFFVWHARYTRAVWRKAHKAKKENTEGKWPLWVEGVVKELFETMQPSTEDLAKSWGLPDPHLKLKLKLKRYSIYFHANLVTQFLKKKKNRNNFQPCVFSRAKNTSILGRSFRKRRRITAG